MAKLIGGPELRARLVSVGSAGPAIKKAWSEDAAKRIASAAPERTGALRSSVKSGERGNRAVVLGKWYGIILDRGTRSYGIEPRRAEVLRFTYRGQTIFTKKSLRKRLSRRPFATQGAHDALRTGPAEIIKAWNRKRASGRFSSLSL